MESIMYYKIWQKGDDIDYYENKIQWKNESLEHTIYSADSLYLYYI